MSKTLLPLSAILQGEQRALVQALRTVAQHDEAAGLNTTPLSFVELQRQIIDTPIDGFPDIDLARKSLLDHLFMIRGGTHSVYLTEAPIPIFFADKIITALFNNNKAHRNIEVAVARLGLLMTTALAQCNEAITDAEHPLRQFIEMVFSHAGIWEPSGGKPGKQLPDFLQALLSRFSELDIQSRETWQIQVKQLEHIRDVNTIRTANLEKRLRDSLDIDPERQRQQQVVSRWVNRKLNGKPLPDDITLFVRLHLIGDMQHLLLQDTQHQSTWSHWQKLLHVLSWIFKDSSDPDFNGKVQNVLIPIVEQLDERYYAGITDSAKYQAFLNHLTGLLIERLQGQAVPCDVFVGQEIEDTAVVVKQAVIQDHDSFNEGQWFLFQRNDGDSLRAKLLLKSVKTDTLVFANYLGKKVYECDFEDFSLQLAAHSAVAINQDQLFKHALYAALKQLELRHRHNLAQHQQALDALEAERNQAAAKARDEACAMEQRKADEQREEQRHIQQRAELQPQALELYQNTLATLQVGAWVAISNSDGSTSNAKLSVKLASTNRYIFTDRLGQPTADLTLDDMIDLMIDQRLEILSKGENFDNKLEQIVKGLRKP